MLNQRGFAGFHFLGFLEAHEAFEVAGDLVAGKGALGVLFVAGDDDHHAFFVEGGRVAFEGGGGEEEGDGRDGGFRGGGVEVAAGNGEADAGIDEGIDFAEVVDHFGELGEVEGDGDVEDLGGLEEAVEVLLATEDFFVADAHGFEEACAVEKASIGGGDTDSGGIFVAGDLAVEEDVIGQGGLPEIGIRKAGIWYTGTILGELGVGLNRAVVG